MSVQRSLFTRLRRPVAVSAALSLLLALFGSGASPGSEPQQASAVAFQVATDDTTYTLCGRVFPDPHAYWPSPAQAPGQSPWAKGNAVCAATDFLSYQQMVDGVGYLESLFPEFVEFYELEEDFGDGADCDTTTDSADYCSAGLPRQGVPAERVRSDLYMLRITDERVPDGDKRFFTFPLSIHGIERAGAEAGVRAAEDLATWAACEAGAAPAVVNCAQEGVLPHPLLETTPEASVTAGEALAGSAIYFVFANPDGWRRGDPDNLARFYQRYNGNGVDMNRDWPTIGYTFEPYTPWSEPETRAFGRVMKEIRDTWDGGIDLHGQLIDRAFSFTLLGASERDYAKDQRILQTVKGAWADAEERLAWSPLIKPNDAPAQCSGTGGEQPCDERMYGVQWGTVWDTIDYTVTGSLGDWIDSPLGLGADGIDNEMSLSHLSNCGVGSCYLPEAEQLHVDGNKSLIYSMVNFTLQPEDTTFEAPGQIGYVFNPKVLTDAGGGTPPPTEGLPPQDPIIDASLDATNGFTYEFDVLGPSNGVYNGGLEAKATSGNVGGISAGSLTELVLEQYRDGEETPTDDAGCAGDEDRWHEVNRYFNQSPVYLQAGQAVHANGPAAGRWRVCMTGALEEQLALNGGAVDLDITFSGEAAWEDPGQLPYSVTNMKFFEDLAAHVAPGELVPVEVDDVLGGTVDLDQFTSLVVADSALPGYVEPLSEGPAQEGFTLEPPVEAAATAPCGYPTQPVLPPTCVADYEFDVDPSFNNQQLVVTLRAPTGLLNDWDLYLERQSRLTGEWFTVAQSATGSGNEEVTVLTPPGGHYRARVVNWSGSQAPTLLRVGFSNEYAGPSPDESTRSDADRDAWGAALRAYVERGGNLVLTDGALRNLEYMGLLPREAINTFTVYAGFIGFTRDGEAATYDDPLAAAVNQPGAAEGPGHRHQTYEPVPIGFAIQNADGADFNASPVWAVDLASWEEAGGRTAGTTTPDQVTLGELSVGNGVVRVIGPLLPMPSQQYYHPFGLANYALTYSGYQVLNNALQWERAFPDLSIGTDDIALGAEFVRGGDEVTISATVHNVGTADAGGLAVRFAVDGEQLGELQTIDAIAAGSSATVSASEAWNTRGLNGEHVITVTVDPSDAVAESDESNNEASRAVLVRGNRIVNGSFEESSDGSSPDAWSGSGTTSYDEGGSDGERSVGASDGGSWTSAPIAVEAGRSYGVSVNVAGASGTLVVEQLSATGLVLGSLTEVLAVADGAPFGTVSTTMTVADGVTDVRVRLSGSLLGTTRFDDARLWEED